MKVLAVVSGQKWLGGLTIHTALLCRELERLGHRVAVVSIGEDAVVDLFPHERTRYGPLAQLWRNGLGGKGGAGAGVRLPLRGGGATPRSTSRRGARRCAGPWPRWRAWGWR